MDPITIALVAAGLGALVAAVFFFMRSVNNARLYENSVSDTKKEISNLRTQVEHLSAQKDKAAADAAAYRERAQTEEAKRRELERKQEAQEIRDFMKEVQKESERLNRETSIAAQIVELAGNPSIMNALKLARLILQSYFLPKHLSKPGEADAALRRRAQEFQDKYDTYDQTT